MFINQSAISFGFMITTWFLAQLTFLVYGIETNQIGFILLFIVYIAILFFGMFVKLDKNDEDDEDLYDERS